MKDKEEFDKYKNSIIDVEELTGTDIKINPEYYIHKALENAQICLMETEVQTGILKYSMLVDHIEILCEAAKILPNDYKDEIRTYSDNLDIDDAKIKSFKIANNKLRLLIKEIFHNKVITDPMLI